MTVERSVTNSGITVITETMPWVRSAALGMWVGVGSRDETLDEWGASHFLEHLLFKGTTSRSQRQIAETFDRIGGDANAFTTKETTCFHARVRDADLADAFAVISDMLVAAVNTEDDVQAERNVVLSEIAEYLDSPDDLVHTDFATALLGEHPLARETLGSEASIETLSRDVIHNYFTRHYRPETITVAAAGNVTHEEVYRLTVELLDDLSRPGGSRPERQAPVAYLPNVVTLRHRPITQTHVVIGVPGVTAADPQRMAIRVLNTLLGGGMSSRLFQTVREERGLAYTAYSYAGTFSDSGVMGAYAATKPSDAHLTAALMRDVMTGLVDTVTSEEVTRAKQSLLGGLVLNLEDTESRMSRLAHHVLLDMPLRSIDDVVAELEQITVDDVKTVAARLFHQPFSLAAVGPIDVADDTAFHSVVA